jgi:ectoine hydroxylase-related dioxygenase (phytanoyl-CoA dioxygenase family)
VRGALISLLGADYTMNAHRHCHYTKPGERGGHWHQDSLNVRHHQIQCVLAMYYPQDVTEEMGPTVVLPGTQYHNTPSSHMGSYMNFKSQVALTVKAGTVAITHYDIWHAWMPNRSKQNRRMLKFLFNRGSAPSAPSWNHTADYRFNPLPFSLPIDGQSDAYKHRVMWRSVWDWLHGEQIKSGATNW